MNFDAVIQGIIRYLDAEIYKGMSDWQEMAARIAVSRILGNKDTLRSSIVNNTFLQTFGMVSPDGMIDVDGLARDIKQQISAKGKLEVSIPIFGRFTFYDADVDHLVDYIKRGG